MPLPIVDLRPYFTPLREFEGVLDWEQIFGNDGPVELDIGCGRGKFLFDSTVAHPATNWVGVELDSPKADGVRGDLQNECLRMAESSAATHMNC